MSSPKKREIRWNLVIVMIVMSALVLLLGRLFPGEATAVIAAGAGVIGAGAVTMKELVNPSAPPPDPEEDEGNITPKGVERIAGVLSK